MLRRSVAHLPPTVRLNLCTRLLFTPHSLRMPAQKRTIASENGENGDSSLDLDRPSPPSKSKRPAKAKVAPPPPGPTYDPVTMRPEKLRGPLHRFQILSWNVAGLRALLKKDPKALATLIEMENPDVVCLQEHKLQEGQHCSDAVEAFSAAIPGWTVHWNCSREKKGYSGTAILCRPGLNPVMVECGIGVGDHDGEGRVITAEFDDPGLFLVNVYVPNSGEGLRRLEYRVGEWDVQFAKYVKGLEQRGKPVVITGDMNCAIEEIDIHSPKTNLRSAGFTQEERESFSKHYLQNGFVDCFRTQHPDVVGYTYWGYRFNLRAKNKGWRLDYFLISKALHGSVHDCFHMPQVMGSDHCPLGLVLRKES